MPLRLAWNFVCQVDMIPNPTREYLTQDQGMILKNKNKLVNGDQYYFQCIHKAEGCPFKIRATEDARTQKIVIESVAGHDHRDSNNIHIYN